MILLSSEYCDGLMRSAGAAGSGISAVCRNYKLLVKIFMIHHTRHDLVLPKHLDVSLAGILHTPIRVVNKSRRRLSTQYRLS